MLPSRVAWRAPLLPTPGELEAEKQMDLSEFKASLCYYTGRATISIYIVIRSHKQINKQDLPTNRFPIT